LTLAVIVLLFVIVPLLPTASISSTQGRWSVDFDNIKMGWIYMLPFLALFLVHNYLVFPFLHKGNKTMYFLLLASLLVVWGLWCFLYTDQPPQGLPPGAAPPPGFPPGPNVGPGGPPPGVPDGISGLERAPLRPEVQKFIMGILVIGVGFGIKTALRLWEREQDNARLERENLRNQLEALRFQINPHFFLNTMNNIQALIMTDPDKAVESVESLSNMMQLTVYQKDTILVPLADELYFTECYFSLMRLRYGDNVQIEFSFPEDTADAVIPPMTVASVAENAFKHGIAANKPSFVALSVALKDGSIICSCSNSREQDKQAQRIGIGKENLRKRLSLVYHDRFSLEESADDAVYKVKLKMPASISIEL